MTPDEVDAFQAYMNQSRQRVEQVIDAEIESSKDGRSQLLAAMRYGVLNGGKRVRAILVYAAGAALGVKPELLNEPAMAVELVHAYSLVHDDLPAMDDDDLRRGKPTCHRAFDEATALLAGDALQALAFEVLSRPPATAGALGLPPEVRLELCSTLATASGARGMAGGQGIDLASVGEALSLDELESMHRFKTGALIRAAVRMGAMCAPGCEQDIISRLDEYAACIGLAFQIRDDVLDVVGDSAVIGKPQGSDEAKNKPTYPSLMGLDAAEARARDLHERAISALSCLGEEARYLRLMSEFIVHRTH